MSILSKINKVRMVPGSTSTRLEETFTMRKFPVYKMVDGFPLEAQICGTIVIITGNSHEKKSQ